MKSVLNGHVSMNLRPTPRMGTSTNIGPEEQFIGLWQGVIRAGGQEIRIVFHINPPNLASSGKESWSATIDSPDQGISGIPVERVTVTGTRIELAVPAAGASFAGAIVEGGVTGHWDQAGSSFSLELVRVDRIEKVKRPQDPEPPFPYESRDISFFGTGGNRFAGTLLLPTASMVIESKSQYSSDEPGAAPGRVAGISPRPFPGVVLLSGSGALNRDEEMFNHRPFLVLADYLARRGFAVLRYDGRGVGGSAGDPQSATIEELAGDAASACRALQDIAEVDGDRIFIVGHSEGGMLAPVVAARDRHVAAIVMLAAPACSGYDLLLQQTAAILRAGGAPDAQIREAQEINKSLYDIVRSESDDGRAAGRLRERTSALGVPAEQIEMQIATMLTPWYRSFLQFDPAVSLSVVSCPVLVLYGERDVQVPADENLAALTGLLRTAGNGEVESRKLGGLNHLFQHASSGLPEEYAKIEETLAPEVLELVADWMRRIGSDK